MAARGGCIGVKQIGLLNRTCIYVDTFRDLYALEFCVLVLKEFFRSVQMAFCLLFSFTFEVFIFNLVSFRVFKTPILFSSVVFNSHLVSFRGFNPHLVSFRVFNSHVVSFRGFI